MVFRVMYLEVNQPHLVLWKEIVLWMIFTGVCVCFTLQSSLIQEVVQVKQSVSGGQVLDETLQ